MRCIRVVLSLLTLTGCLSPLAAGDWTHWRGPLQTGVSFDTGLPEKFSLDPTFHGFAGWADREGLPLTVVSDGFGFYVRPMLEAAGLGRLDVRTNGYLRGRLSHPNGHPVCVGCGTCKMLAAAEHRNRYGPVAFVGEGQSDRYGALYSDLVFAKKDLVRICLEDGVPYREWETFDDVRSALQSTQGLPGPAGPARCPGWRELSG